MGQRLMLRLTPLNFDEHLKPMRLFAGLLRRTTIHTAVHCSVYVSKDHSEGGPGLHVFTGDVDGESRNINQHLICNQ